MTLLAHLKSKERFSLFVKVNSTHWTIWSGSDISERRDLPQVGVDTGKTETLG